MAELFFPLTALSEAQRAQAFERFTIIRPALEEGVSRAQVARTSKKAPSTIQLWIKRYREKGLAGLANNVSRSDKGMSRTLPERAQRTYAQSVHRSLLLYGCSGVRPQQLYPSDDYRIYVCLGEALHNDSSRGLRCCQ